MPKQRSLAPAVSGHAEPTLVVQKVNSQSQQKKSMPRQVQSAMDPQGYTLMMADPLKQALYPKPDDSAYATNVQRMKDVYDITTNASGEFFISVGSALAGGTFPTPTITASAVTTLGSAVASQWYTALSNENAQYRTLIFVLEWKPSMSVNAGTGAVFIGSYPATTAVVGSGVPLQALSAYFDDIGASGPATKPACAVLRPTTPPSFGVMSASQTGFFSSAVLVGTGLPASVVVGKLHVSRIYELEPLSGTMSALSAVNSPCDMTACCIGANILGQGVTFNAGEDKPYERVVATAIGLARKALSAYMNYSTGGAMALARMFM